MPGWRLVPREPCAECYTARDPISTKRCRADREQPLCRSCASKARWRNRHGEPKSSADYRRYSIEYNRKNEAWLKLHYMGQRDLLKREMVDAYGGKCARCPEDDIQVLALDHIHDDGAASRRRNGWGDPYFRKLKREGWPQGRHQILCYNCNTKKEMKRRRDALLLKLKELELATQGTA